MSADQGAPGTPQEEPTEGEVLEVSAEEVAAPAPEPPPVVPAESVPPPIYSAPLPAAEGEHHDDVEVTLVPEPADAAPVVPAPVVPAAPAAPAPAPVQPVAAAPVEPPAPSVPAGVTAAPVGVPAAPAPGGPVAAAGDAQWYTTSGGQVYGPYTAANLREWLKSGQVTWETQASRGGADPWRPLHQIVEFNPSPAYGAPPGTAFAAGRKDRTVAGILGILLGAFGAHHWYLGNYVYAGIYLGVTVLTAGILSVLPAIAGIVEGIMYLTATEERFQEKYSKWFMSG